MGISCPQLHVNLLNFFNGFLFLKHDNPLKEINNSKRYQIFNKLQQLVSIGNWVGIHEIVDLHLNDITGDSQFANLMFKNMQSGTENHILQSMCQKQFKKHGTNKTVRP